MRLDELLALRAVPAAGVALGLTQRCPLSCAHCSTSSTASSMEAPAALFRRFVDSFSGSCRPDVLAMSGGEPLLRPELVRELAERANDAGTRSTVLSGVFFAASRRMPDTIRAAIKTLHHFSASVDSFHEQEVPRADVFRVLEAVLDEGVDASLHIVGKSAADPYLTDLVDEVQRVFGHRVPMLVNVVSAFGRARNWCTLKAPDRAQKAEANPCAMAAWPVVGFDGTVVACGNDDALVRVPEHLRLGHASTDDWATIRERTLARSMLRAIRLFGPEYLSERHLRDVSACGGYCETCMSIPSTPAVRADVEKLMDRPSTVVLEKQVSEMQRSAGPVSFAHRHGVPRYARLVSLGVPN